MGRGCNVLFGASVVAATRPNNSIQTGTGQDKDVLSVILSKGEYEPQCRERTSCLSTALDRRVQSTTHRNFSAREVSAVFRSFYACPYTASKQICIKISANIICRLFKLKITL